MACPSAPRRIMRKGINIYRLWSTRYIHPHPQTNTLAVLESWIRPSPFRDPTCWKHTGTAILSRFILSKSLWILGLSGKISYQPPPARCVSNLDGATVNHCHCALNGVCLRFGPSEYVAQGCSTSIHQMKQGRRNKMETILERTASLRAMLVVTPDQPCPEDRRNPGIYIYITPSLSPHSDYPFGTTVECRTYKWAHL
ncbi:hypothetical protein CONPUDRAFT_77190 [Coniophora puteana RWD-64-598 SS2]|uniref:Uncharacterized protein n=1 Tax=Coniophora puteana (strain RWD-64-598) TaxID=741705 RepID=A0A5M3MA38_CONPW|nr:uncharacterized protein CONPUDRAFT_77190 [Coniophora puteana RWD-64-598 SS2]EIW75511.1 hypothetical protein CONPUDRAFT_77190 [Coniophora puteana RWD-64-598 SS2]